MENYFFDIYEYQLNFYFTNFVLKNTIQITNTYFKYRYPYTVYFEISMIFLI